jgi:Cof subfamily protein (haloacid dehalogenase superfamily)
MNRKAVFLDVDGTLVNDRGLVPDSARLAVELARANGHLMFLCTGRSLSELWQEITDIGFDGVIAAAGGYVEVGGEVLAHHNVPIEEVRSVVAYFDARGIDYFLESNSGLYGSANSQARMRHLFFGSVRNEDVLAELQRGLGGFIDSLVVGADTNRTDINKVFFLDSDTPLEAIRAEFDGIFDVIPATVPMLGPNSGELSLAGVHKAAGIQTLIEHLGIAREDTLAYGDGLNDLEMLAYVHTGVAMGNAHPEAKEAADDLTGSPDQHGIHASFTKYGLI